LKEENQESYYVIAAKKKKSQAQSILALPEMPQASAHPSKAMSHLSSSLEDLESPGIDLHRFET